MSPLQEVLLVDVSDLSMSPQWVVWGEQCTFGSLFSWVLWRSRKLGGCSLFRRFHWYFRTLYTSLESLCPFLWFQQAAIRSPSWATSPCVCCGNIRSPRPRKRLRSMRRRLMWRAYLRQIWTDMQVDDGWCQTLTDHFTKNMDGTLFGILTGFYLVSNQVIADSPGMIPAQPHRFNAVSGCFRHAVANSDARKEHIYVYLSFIYHPFISS